MNRKYGDKMIMFCTPSIADNTFMKLVCEMEARVFESMMIPGEFSGPVVHRTASELRAAGRFAARDLAEPCSDVAVYGVVSKRDGASIDGKWPQPKMIIVDECLPGGDAVDITSEVEVSDA